ncbi:MAG: hypothetical protein M0P39_09915 [Rhodocyclaceae bacterium]|jgi:hypothetical protein|nr:hypothetical protein [Rhodocyclaceae bacterium]
MEIRPAIQIQAMIKSMIDVVLPAVDPEHKMAQEQAQLIIGTLKMMGQRLPLQFRYDRKELDEYVALSVELLKQMRGSEKTQSAMKELGASQVEGAAVLDRARAEPGELETAVFDLRAKVGALVKAVGADGEAASRDALKHLILDAAENQLQRELSWQAALGYSDPAELQPIENLIGVSPAR